MAYLEPHFDPDVFVSYSHGDPRGMGKGPLKAWTHNLIERLKEQIFSLETDFDSTNIWYDGDIDPTAELSPELREKVRSCGILFIIMSKRLLKSRWCKEELEWFRERIGDRAEDQRRVFLLQAQRTDVDQWPLFLRSGRDPKALGFKLFDVKTGDPMGWNDPDNPKDAFNIALAQVRTVLVRRLQELRDKAGGPRSKSFAPSPVSPPVAAARSRRIFLHAPRDREADLAGVKHALTADGFRPLSLPAMPGAGADAAKQRSGRLALARVCEATALLRIGDDDGFVDDVYEIGGERREIAHDLGAPLPCAVLDAVGGALPIDVGAFDIVRFDIRDDAWRAHFRNWLDGAHAQPSAAA